MYSKKDIQFVGKHDFDRKRAEMFSSFSESSFSVNIFKWGMKSNGKELKPLKCVVRVIGNPKNKEKVFQEAKKIVNLLDNGKWDGRKTVSVS